ncbi:MAG: methyltransferase [Flavobacteriales bacterium]|nr:methyltransferase [Flavobacteriales bacterium]
MFKRIISKPLQIWAKWYFEKPRKYNYRQIKGIILPGVFYPYFTISTKLLLEFIEDLDLRGKSLLELGCGTGMISTLAAKKGAKVLASDINPAAIENVGLNATKNAVKLELILSDLFEKISQQTFDYIIINPPYYPKAPKNRAEEAWFCGVNFDYFEKLFSQLGDYLDGRSEVYMILSEDCEIEHIKGMADCKQFVFDLELQVKKRGEENYIFRIRRK